MVARWFVQHGHETYFPRFDDSIAIEIHSAEDGAGGSHFSLVQDAIMVFVQQVEDGLARMGSRILSRKVFARP